MPPLFSRADSLTGEVIGAAVEVHRDKGPGLLESIYERCLAHELHLRGLATVNQRVVRVAYKDLVFDEPLRFDLLVEDCVLVENKYVESVLPIHKAQLLSYMKLLGIPVGLLINWHSTVLKNDIHRMMLPGANVA